MTPPGTKPAPPRVDRYAFWNHPPPKVSARCSYWCGRILFDGWRPGRRVRALGYDCRAEFYGVCIWELLNIIDPLLSTSILPVDNVNGSR